MSAPHEYQGVVDFNATIPNPFDEAMTVSTLIAMLSMFDQSLPVFLGGEFVSAAQEALVQKVALNADGVSQFRDYDLDDTARDCVVLS